MAFVEEENIVEKAKVEDSPVRGGGASFKTERIIFSSGMAEVKKTLGMKIFLGFFMVLGAVLLFGAILVFLAGGADGVGGAVVLVITGGVFFAFGSYMFFYKKSLVFDKSTGIYYAGKAFDYMDTEPDSKKQGKLKDIKSVQIVPERIRNKNKTYISYEINLVLKDGNRINVVDHANKNAIIEDANNLKDFLDVPVSGLLEMGEGFSIEN